jgi:hypothetical protein
VLIAAVAIKNRVAAKLEANIAKALQIMKFLTG